MAYPPSDRDRDRVEILDLGPVGARAQGPDGDGQRQGIRRLWLFALLILSLLGGALLWPREEVGQPSAAPSAGRSAAPSPSTTAPGSGASPGAGVQGSAGSSVATSPPATQISLGRPLLPGSPPWELVGVAADNGDLIRVEPATGRMVRIRLGWTVFTGEARVFAGSDEVLVISPAGQEAVVVEDGAPVRRAPGLAQASPLEGVDQNHVWVPYATRIVLTALDGAATRTSVALPAMGPLHGGVSEDGGGGLLVSSPAGGVYTAGPDGIRRISVGTVLAVGPVGWLVLECDDRLRCARVLIDRRDGARREVPGLPEGLAVPGRISPDGARAVITRWTQDGQVQELTDLSTGTSRGLGVTAAENPEGAAAWSPDGRWLVLLRGEYGSPVVVDACTGTPRVLGVDLPRLAAMDVRDLVPTRQRPRPACPSR